MNSLIIQKKKRFEILRDDQNHFSIQIFQGYDQFLFDLSILGLLIFFSILYLLYLLEDVPNNLDLIIILIYLFLSLSFLIDLAFFEGGIVYYILNIDKACRTIGLTKNFIFFNLRQKKYPIDFIKEVRVEKISNSDGFVINNYYSLKLLFTNNKEIKIYRNNIDIKSNPIEMVNKDANELKQILIFHLRLRK